MKNRLTTMREKTGWTADELADSVGVSTGCIKAIENGSYGPSLFLAYAVPRRVRLEELAARPWYVRLFFD
jgi:putative transcriptional regulator